MGVLKTLLDRLNDEPVNADEFDEIIREIEAEGTEATDKIAERLGQKNTFVPKVKVPPIDFDKLPDGCEINKFGEIVRTGNIEEGQEEEK